MTATALPLAGFAASRRHEFSEKNLAQAGNRPDGGLLYFVDSAGDGGLVGSSNFCNDGTGHCTLRAAIEAANLHPGDDGIEISIAASDPNCVGGNCTINLTQALPDLNTNMEITGPGAGQLTVRPITGGNFRVFTVTTSGVVALSGLAMNNGVALDSNGGGILNSGSGTVNVTNCVINRNFADNGEGGGLYNNGGTMNVTNSTISDNRTSNGKSGGGISNSGTVNVTNSTLSGNITSGGSGSNGGGINNNGTVNVTNSTLSGNTATQGFGGGINNNINGTVSVTNSALSGNSATLSSFGSGGGIRNLGTMQVKNSIIALNTNQSSPDVSGTFTSAGFNLIGKNAGAENWFPSGNPNANNDIVGTTAAPVDPKLDPNGLQNNGGLTPTISLLFGSPAIDKGTSAGLTGTLTTDQRGAGFPRTLDDPGTLNATGGDGSDIGSFELQTVSSILANISTRLRVETGDNVLIGGFIITGTQPKKVILRAIGPSLPLAGSLANPSLELRTSSGDLIASNDNWRSTQEAEIIATTIPPANDFESAIVATLPANTAAYTAILRGVNDGTGIGLVEAYDLDQTVDSKLSNISTRGLVQAGDNVLIGGFIVLGQNPLRVIVRAIGPSLPVPGALGDPNLELRDGNGALLVANDDWRTDQQAEIIATTIPPTNDLESAIVRDLTPGNYTAIVRGANNSTGVALVEAYGLN